MLKEIEYNGGGTGGLNLSNKVFEDGIDLRGINNNHLPAIILKRAVLEQCHLEEVRLTNAQLQGAFLEGAHLEGASLRGGYAENAEFISAHLQKACLTGAHLEGAQFYDAHLEGSELINAFLDRTRLSGAYLQGAHLLGAKFSASTHMESINWGDYKIGEEKDGEKKGQKHKLKWAEDIYRSLKLWYTNAGMYDIAGQFFYREMEARRKIVQDQIVQQLRVNKASGLKHIILKLKGTTFYLLWAWVLKLLCGYGEKPKRVVIFAASFIFSLALAYYFWGSFVDAKSFADTLYYSVVSFTALGYGQWAPQPTDWAQGMGAVEAVIGVFSMALFLVTFTRKMTR